MTHLKRAMERRTFLSAMLAAALPAGCRSPMRSTPRTGVPPNIVFVFADQWRAQATGYAGDPNARTPHLDQLASESLNFTHAVSGCPVCAPYRASLITGQYWLSHGVFLNDVPLREDAVTIAKVLRENGYHTGYIGKWHLDGRGRSSYTPPARRQGFEFWKALECSHDYNASIYYDDAPEPKHWEGYDAAAQTRAAQTYLRAQNARSPFALFLSWGPPHNPYETAPEQYRDRLRGEDIVLRPNVPPECAEAARKDLAGYYAHIMALDDCLGELLHTLDQCGLAKNTIFVFTSDHGDMLYSQGMQRKQRPYDESIRVPFLLRYPNALGKAPRQLDCLINAPDIMPTLLGLCGIHPPATVEGQDISPALLQGKDPHLDDALLACIAPFGEWTRKQGGREFRGLRTKRHTYLRSLDGPWILFDNARDPYQRTNLCGNPAYRAVQRQLDARLMHRLAERKDAFEPGNVYTENFGYHVDASGTIPIHP